MRDVVIRKGEIVFDGDVENAIDFYFLNDMYEENQRFIEENNEISFNQKFNQIISSHKNENLSGIYNKGLIQYLDAGNFSSYPGNGREWKDLTKILIM